MTATLPASRLHRPAFARITVTLLGLAGTVALVVGVLLPWISTFQGLLSENAWGTSNGKKILVLAGAVLVATIAHLVRPIVPLRWALALLGLGAAAYSGYLLIQLDVAVGKVDGMAFASRGPGIYTCLAGGVLAFATIFLPMTASDGGEAAAAESTTPTSARFGILRPAVAVLALVGGLAHLPVIPEHLEEVRYLGVLFILQMVAMILGATALLIAERRVLYLALGVIAGLTAVGYAISRTVGLPGMSDDIGNWLEPWGVVATLAEIAVVVLTVVALRRHRATQG